MPGTPEILAPGNKITLSMGNIQMYSLESKVNAFQELERVWRILIKFYAHLQQALNNTNLR